MGDIYLDGNEIVIFIAEIVCLFVSWTKPQPTLQFLLFYIFKIMALTTYE